VLSAEAQAGEIDLSATAREALTDPAPAPSFAPSGPGPAAAPRTPAPLVPAALAEEPEMAIFVPDDVRPVGPPPAAPRPAAAPPPVSLAEPDPVPIFMADPDPPSLAPPPAAVSFAPPPKGPDTAPYVPSRTPDLSIPPAPAGVGPSKREAREWKPPARSGAPAPPARPTLPPDLDPEPAKPAASRPSKDDLAALDALLNAKGLEGPLQPLPRPSPERWSPQFGGRDRPAGGARAAGSSGRARAALIALALAGGVTGAFWYYFVRPQPGASASSAASPAPTATPSAVVADASPATRDGGRPPLASPTTAVPMRTAASPSPGSPTLRTPPPPVSTPPPVASPPPRPPASGNQGGLREARAQLARGQLAEAARGFAAHLRAAPRGTTSVQLLVACSGETVQKAVSSVASPELYIVPVRFQGRDCFRLCWGLYTSPSQAASAARALPDYFRKGGATPRVMTAAELLP